MPKKQKIPQIAERVASEIICKPATANYPFVKPELFENCRGEPIFDSALCIGCGLCSRECPSKAIEMIEVEGKKRPEIHLDKCIFCCHCVEVCPKQAIKNSGLYELATTDKSTLAIKPKPAEQK
jgi:NADH-quinone oxidoreductase subunit I